MAKNNKPEQPQIHIKGPFVRTTFLRVCRAHGTMETDALLLFSALQKRGEIIESGNIGINQEVKSFIFKKQ